MKFVVKDFIEMSKKYEETSKKVANECDNLQMKFISPEIRDLMLELHELK